MLLAYGDESMDESCQRVCAVAGVIGSEDAWKFIEPRWTARNGNAPFHAKDCESDQGMYAPRPSDNRDEKHENNLELYKDLTILLCESELSGFAACSDLAMERRYDPDLPMLYLREFRAVIEALCWWARERGEIARMCFDGRKESDHNAALLYAQMREQFPEWSPHLAETIEFDYSKTNARKQIADLFAREAMKHLDNRIGPQERAPRKSWLALEATERFHIFEFRENFFEQQVERESSLNLGGRRSEQYFSWLLGQKRQHNLTNAIEFVGKHPNPILGNMLAGRLDESGQNPTDCANRSPGDEESK